MDFSTKECVKNPWDNNYNPISYLFFTWVLPLFRKGFSKELTINDIYDTPKVHGSSQTALILNKSWEKEKLKSKEKGKEPRFLKALFNVHKIRLMIYLAIATVDELIVRVMQPIYLRKLVRTFNDDSDDSSSDQIIFASIVCLCSLFHDLVVHQCVFLMMRTGLYIRTATSSLIYRKGLRLSSSSSEQASVGYLMNLLSNDLSRFDYQLIFLPYIIIGPIQLIILLYFLYDEMGYSALAAAAFILVILPTQVLNARLSAKFRDNVAAQTDSRSRIMNEIVIAIRVIKMYAWEKPFAAIISRIRGQEVKELSKRAYLRGFFLSLYTFSTRLTSFFVIMTYVLVGNEITADKAFFCVAISLTIVETMVFCFSSSVSGIGEMTVSANRIQKFLLLDEQVKNGGNSLDNSSNLINANLIPKENEKKFESIGSVSLSNVTASWVSSEKPTLKNLTTNISGDKVVMIVGPVGSGKTSLLHLLISELPVLEGIIQCEGKMSYAAQEAWIFPGNVRQNILFGEPFDQDHYQKVIFACSLQDDFNQLENGDMSIVGERGITLSGGQKARINLARSIYNKAHIYIMDDPLSAVDSKVSRHIFEKCVKGLKGKLRIIVTHQLNYLPQADYVILLNNGRIHAQGAYQDLVNNGVDFKSIMASDKDNPESTQRKMSTVKGEEEGKGIFKEYEKPEENVEKMVEGSVSMKTYLGYISSAKSPFGLFIILLLFISTQFLLTSSEFWLSYWTDAEERRNNIENSSERNSSFISPKEVVQIFDPGNYLGQNVYLGVYAGLVTAVFIFTLTRAVGFFTFCLRISNNLHNSMFNSIVRAPNKFFDENTSGRIMNRFTKDMGSVDELLPLAVFDSIDYFLQMFGVIVVIVLSNYYLIIPTLIIIAIFWLLRIVFVRTSRDVKRLESIWKSPVFTHVAASLQGLTTIRALGSEAKLIQQFDDKQDIHSSAMFGFISIARCFAVWAETIAILFLTVVTFSFLLFASDSSGGLVGLVITSTLALSVNIQWAIRQSAETENNMTAVERAIEYTKITPEAPLESTKDKKPPSSDWPKGGEVRFQNMSLSYEGKDVLKNLTFDIRAKEKIGIVGRTGAGKSSIIAALFRLTEPRGDILIDGIRINEIGLHELRKSISIIPQDPVLFSGTMRYNLDPFDQFDDSQLWTVLQEVRLKEHVSALDFKVTDGGSNFSVGQRQLICLARAILRQNKIIVLDEITANCDERTDEFIQKTIRTKFSDCSIITIAHRLHSVMDCDRILVLESGEIKEYDHPHLLFRNSDGMLTRLAAHTGQSTCEKLHRLAKQHYDSCH